MSLSVDAVDIKKRIESCKNLQEVEGIRLEFLGKKGLIPSEMKLLGKLSIDERNLKGQELNNFWQIMQQDRANFRKSRGHIGDTAEVDLSSEWWWGGFIDWTSYTKERIFFSRQAQLELKSNRSLE